MTSAHFVAGIGTLHPFQKRTLEIFVAVVEQHDAHVAAVVLVHDARARGNAILYSQARTGGHPAVGAGRHRNGQVGFDQTLAPSGNHRLFGTT